MKKTKKVLISVVGASLIACSVPYAVYAESEEPVPTVYNVNVRIEGISELIYSDSLEIWGAEYFTAADVLNYVDLQEDSVTITGIEDSYITDVNGDSAGVFGGWDGWLYMVNGEEASVGMSDCQITDGDSILLYFGDPYGEEGFQFPEAVFDNERGVLTFTSLDTTYDADWNPVLTENPVTDMNVYWDDTAYITDDSGQVKIDSAQLTEGTHSVSYDKYAESGLPLVLRSEAGLSFEVTPLAADVNDDRIITAVDAAMILGHYASVQSNGPGTLGADILPAADVNGDSVVTASDAATVLSYYAYSQSAPDSITFSEYLNTVFGK